MTNTIHNVANLGVARPRLRGILMTNHIPSSADIPLPTPLAGQNLPPPQDERKILEEPCINPINLNPQGNRGETLNPSSPKNLYPHRQYSSHNWSGALVLRVDKEYPSTCTLPPLGGNFWPTLGQRLPTPRTQGEVRFIPRLVRRPCAGSF